MTKGNNNKYLFRRNSKDLQEQNLEVTWVPKKILSDKRLQFVSRFMEELKKALGMKRMLSTAYHPQSDGQTERINQEIGMFLQYYINYQQDNWTEWITVAEFHYNDKRHATTRQMLFILNFGRHSWKKNLEIQTEISKLEEFLMKLQRSRKEAKKSMEEAQENIKQQYNKKRRNSQKLKVGDNIWLENKNINSKRLSKKLDKNRYGPFRISKDIGLGVFQLELLKGWMIHNMLNKDLLTKCNELQFKGQYVEPAPPPTIINKEKEYEVEEV